MLIFIILAVVIGLFLLIFFARKTDSTQDSCDYSHSYSSTTPSDDSFQGNDDKRMDDCSFNIDSSSDSSSYDSSSND